MELLKWGKKAASKKREEKDIYMIMHSCTVLVYISVDITNIYKG